MLLLRIFIEFLIVMIFMECIESDFRFFEVLGFALVHVFLFLNMGVSLGYFDNDENLLGLIWAMIALFSYGLYFLYQTHMTNWHFFIKVFIVVTTIISTLKNIDVFFDLLYNPEKIKVLGEFYPHLVFILDCLKPLF